MCLCVLVLVFILYKESGRLRWEADVAVVYETLCCYMGRGMQDQAGRRLEAALPQGAVLSVPLSVAAPRV